MLSNQEYLNRKLQEGKSIAWFARGYYISRGINPDMNLKIPIFDIKDNLDMIKPHETTQVLCECFGELMWINVQAYNIMVGTVPNNYSKEGKYIRAMLECLKN